MKHKELKATQRKRWLENTTQGSVSLSKISKNCTRFGTERSYRQCDQATATTGRTNFQKFRRQRFTTNTTTTTISRGGHSYYGISIAIGVSAGPIGDMGQSLVRTELLGFQRNRRHRSDLPFHNWQTQRPLSKMQTRIAHT